MSIRLLSVAMINIAMCVVAVAPICHASVPDPEKRVFVTNQMIIETRGLWCVPARHGQGPTANMWNALVLSSHFDNAGPKEMLTAQLRPRDPRVPENPEHPRVPIVKKCICRPH
jgi:hypothetical protein